MALSTTQDRQNLRACGMSKSAYSPGRVCRGDREQRKSFWNVSVQAKLRLQLSQAAGLGARHSGVASNVLGGLGQMKPFSGLIPCVHQRFLTISKP